MDFPRQRQQESASLVVLWYGVLVGPGAWALDEGLSYAITQHACSTGQYYILHVISVICFLLAATGIAAGALERMAAQKAGSVRDRSLFMAHLGIVTSLTFALVIVALAVPRWILTPCD